MKLTRLAVAAATAVSMTLVGAGVAQSETTKEQTTTEATATEEASSEGLSSNLSSTDAEADEDANDDAETDEDGEEADEMTQMSSQTIEDNAGPFAPILLAIMPTLGGFFSVIDQLVGMLSLIAGPALNAQYSAK